MKFNQESLNSQKWIKALVPEATVNEVNAFYAQHNQAKGPGAEQMKDFQKIYEGQRQLLNYSWFDMMYFVTDKVDKKL